MKVTFFVFELFADVCARSVFDLEAQIEINKPKIAKLSHYEAWIDKLSQNLVKWSVSSLMYCAD